MEGHLNGLGYMVDTSGTLAAAPVIVLDHTTEGPMRGSRIVSLDFQPVAGYWESRDGLELIRQAAAYAHQGASSFFVDTLFSVIRPNEPPQISVHLSHPRHATQSDAASGEVRVELLSADMAN